MFTLSPYTGLPWGNQPGPSDWVDPNTGMLKRQPLPWEKDQADQALQQYADQQALKNWQGEMDTLNETFKAPAIDTEAIINKGTDEINEGERSAALALQQAGTAASGGARMGGSTMGGLQDLHSAFAGQRANLARDTRLGAAQMNANFELQKARAKMDLMRRKPVSGLAQVGTGGGGQKQGGVGWSISGGGMGANAIRPAPWKGRQSGTVRPQLGPGF